MTGQLQHHLLPAAAGAVDGVDYFQGLVALLAGNPRLAVVGDGVREIPELALEGL